LDIFYSKSASFLNFVSLVGGLCWSHTQASKLLVIVKNTLELPKFITVMQCSVIKNAFGDFILHDFYSKPASLVLYPSSLVSLVLYQGPLLPHEEAKVTPTFCILTSMSPYFIHPGQPGERCGLRHLIDFITALSSQRPRRTKKRMDMTFLCARPYSDIAIAKIDRTALGLQVTADIRVI
jgi:hypothetical protein